ncbi:hypothetical protein [Plantactinospora sp. GCM10030261]
METHGPYRELFGSSAATRLVVSALITRFGTPTYSLALVLAIV